VHVQKLWILVYIRQRYSNNAKDDVFIGPFCSAVFSNPVLPPLQKRQFQLAQIAENTRFQRWFFENFSGGIAPRPPYWEGATAPLPRPHPLSALQRFAPPRLARDLRSLHRCPKYFTSAAPLKLSPKSKFATTPPYIVALYGVFKRRLKMHRFAQFL